MSNPLVECIPNFSEARRPEVVEEIINSISSVSGISILDKHSDLDHNRTVVTFIGSPNGVEEAAYQAIKTAAKLINLNIHTGEHPRIGATDVVPFVPINDISMPECVEMAKRLGKRVGESLNLPVYLYEEAASSPERQNLENIRRGQYEGLKKDICIDSSRKPDFGPAELGPAGATVIGARQPLIAFNAYLTTGDVKTAQKIARDIRHSSGGFRFVKAMGILVDGRAQVSMNLTNFRQTPIARVVETIRFEAQRYGVSIHHCELVGMIPQEAMVDAAKWYLQLDAFLPDQILEQKLAASKLEDHPKLASQDFIDKLAAGTPTPGGGSAAAHTGAAAAALVEMVCHLSIGRKKYASFEKEFIAILGLAGELRSKLAMAVEKDSEVFEQFMLASKLPKFSPEEIQKRAEAIETAAINAALVPLEVARNALKVTEMANFVAENGNLNAISDSATSAALARAAITGASLNVRINLVDLPENGIAQSCLKEIESILEKSSKLEKELNLIIQQRSNLKI